jgi:hypothetical protein
MLKRQKEERWLAMSQGFRPVREIWNMHSSCFVAPGELIVLLHDLAARVGTVSDEHEYGDNKAVWLEDGNKVLDYMEADERFNAAQFQGQPGGTRDRHQPERPEHPDREYAKFGKTVAEFHWRTWRTGVLYRCLLNPAKGLDAALHHRAEMLLFVFVDDCPRETAESASDGVLSLHQNRAHTV